MPVLAGRRFVTTRWSLVLAAGQDTAPEAQKALSELCRLYWSPIHEFILNRVRPAEKAEDLTQGFFTRLLEKNDLAVLDPVRGRFRAWLKASVQNYLANEWDRERAKKRGRDWVRIDDAEGSCYQEPSPGLTPDRAFERRWALTLLENTLAALREEHARRGKALFFDRLKGKLIGDEGDSYSLVAEEFGMTEDAVKVRVFRLRQRYRELLRQEISHTVKNPQDIDDELRFLFSVLKAE